MSDNENMTPADSLAIIESEQRRLSRRVQFNPALVNAMWAGIWFVGFGVAYLGYGNNRYLRTPGRCSGAAARCRSIGPAAWTSGAASG